MTRGRRSLVGAAMALAAASVGAQDREPAPVRIAPVGTERVQVAVVVTDHEGRPVTDLEPGDFRLLEDGKAQILTHFVGAVSAPGARAALDAPEAPGAAASAGASPGRHIVLAIDDLHLTHHSLIQAKEALKRFVAAQMSESDEVAVVTTSGALGVLQPFTTNAWALRKVIDRVGYDGHPGSAGRVPMSEFLAESIVRGDPEALALTMNELSLRDQILAPFGVVNPRHEPEALSQAHGVLAQALSASARSVRALDRVLRGLARLSGRKLAILVSDGFLLGEGTGPEAIDLRRIFDASARGGVAVYCLDSRGLVGITGGDASAEAQLTMTRKPGAAESYDRLEEMTRRGSLAALAEGTGGVFVHGTNDLGAGFDRILRDADASYLLGYEPTATERTGRFRNIEVELPDHRGLRVRARRGYFAADDRIPKDAPGGRAEAVLKARRLEEIRGALSALVPLRDLPVRMSVDYFNTGPETAELVLSAHVDLTSLRFDRVGDRDQAEVEILGVVYDAKGDVVGEFKPEQARLDLATSSSEEARREGFSYKRSATLRPAAYQVRVVARGASHSQLGSASDWVEIPPLRGGPLRLSSLFLYAAPPLAEGAAVAPPDTTSPPQGLRDVQALRRFGPRESLYYEIYAYAAARDGTEATDVVLQSQVWSGGELLGVSPEQSVPFAGKDVPATLSGTIALRDLVPGSYELRILVVDRKSQATALRRTAFTME